MESRIAESAFNHPNFSFTSDFDHIFDKQAMKEPADELCVFLVLAGENESSDGGCFVNQVPARAFLQRGGILNRQHNVFPAKTATDVRNRVPAYLLTKPCDNAIQ